MAEFLLDTNIISDLVRNPAGRTAARLREIDQRGVCTSVVVAAELRYGVQKRGSRRLADQVEAILASIEIAPLAPPVDFVYAQLRVELDGLGRTIGANDFLIAAHALALDCTLVTDNDREFSRVSELRTQNWLR